ncbi:MAG: hypothetical protein JXA93_07350 [Anaerolineae bacterium]|nr:hypothetical protein [Anaerolineae bacterium]
MMQSRLARQIAVRAAALLGSGNGHPSGKWWFDLEYVDEGIRSWDQETKIGRMSTIDMPASLASGEKGPRSRA